MLPQTWWGLGLAAAGIVIVLHITWKFISFAMIAAVLMGDHKVRCQRCKKEILPHASGIVVDMLQTMQDHHCIVKED